MNSLFHFLRNLLIALTGVFLSGSSTTSFHPSPISPSLIELLDVMGVKHNGTLCSIVDATEKQWLRPAGKERWEIADLPPEKAKRVIELAGQIGLFKEVNPSEQKYDYCLLMGATAIRMQLRINYIIQLWNQGVRFHEMVILTGERPLDPVIEQLDHCSTEADAAYALWMNTPMPNELRELPITFVNVPMISNDLGTYRPKTSDTIKAWLALNPHPGSCLFISNQPYCQYQNAVAKTTMPSVYPFEVVGESAKPAAQNAAVVLDTIARWLYNEAIAQNQCSIP